jgi:transcriptional regulator with XRE-family HTH domain
MPATNTTTTTKTAGVRGLQDQRVKTDRRARFGKALDEAMRSAGWNQQGLAEPLHTTQSSVSAWIHGKNVPSADDVFEIELLLDLTPGSLSRHLGYQPVGADQAPPDMEQTISVNPHLDADSKEMMKRFYRTLRAASKKVAAANGNGRSRAAVKQILEPSVSSADDRPAARARRPR